MRIQPWTEKQLMSREATFEALMDKALRMTVRRSLLDVGSPLTAAVSDASPPPPTVSFTALESAVLATWSGFVDRELYPFTVDTFMESTEKVVDGLVEGGKAVLDVLTNTYAAEFLQYARNRLVGIGDDLWRNMRTELEEGFAAGEGVKEIAGRLQQVAGITEPRAKMVARTELISAANAGSFLQVVAAGFDSTDTTKIWLATEDDRTRLSHRHADEQDVPLLDEFSVDIYSGAVKTGSEDMEFPGDPVATPGNVINCRCSLAFEFSDDEDDDVLTADGFVEAEHPRKKDGKFKKKGASAGIDLIKSLLEHVDAMTPAQTVSFIKNIDKNDWNKLSEDDKGKLIKKAEATSNPEAKLAGQKALDALMSAPAGRPVGGKDTKTGKALSPGKPVKLRVQLLYNTEFEDGAVMAVRKDSDERLIWNGKKIERQKKGADGKFATTETRTRGDAYKAWKDEDGWTVPEGVSAVEDASPASAPSGGKPIFLRVQTIYNTKYADGEVVAVKPDNGWKITWDASKKRMVLDEGDGKKTEYTRGALYAGFKDSPGWFTPGADVTPNEPDDSIGTDVSTPSVNVPAVEAPVKKTKGAPAVLDPETNKWSKPVKFSVVFNGTTHTRTSKNNYTHVSIVHYPPNFVGGEKDVLYSWHSSEALALKGTLTGSQKKNGAYVKEVLPVQLENAVASAPVVEAPTAPEVKPFKQVDHIGGESNDKMAAALNDSTVPDGTVLFEQDPQGATSGIKISKVGNGKGAITYNNGTPVPIDAVEIKDTLILISKISTAKDAPASEQHFIGSGDISKIINGSEEKDKFGDTGVLHHGPNYTVIKKHSGDIAIVGDNGNIANIKQGDLSGPELKKGLTAVLNAPETAVAKVVYGHGAGTSTVRSAAVVPVPLKLGYSVLVNPKTTKYTNGQVIAVNPEQGERLIWSGSLKKYVVQKKSGNNWAAWHAYTKQGAYKNLKNDDGWFTPGTEVSDSSTPPSVSGNPVSVSVAKAEDAATKKLKMEIGELKKAASEKVSALTDLHVADIYKAFRYKDGATTAPVRLTSMPSDVLEGILAAQLKHNKANPGNQLNMLEAIQAVDIQASKDAGAPNKNLFEKKLTDWLQTPEGKKKAAQVIAEFRMSPAEKAKILADKKAAQEAALAAQLKSFHDVKLSSPSTTSTDFKTITPANAQTMQNKMLESAPWTSAEKAALTKYSGSYYHAMNGVLRGTTPPNADLIKDVTNAQKGMRPLGEDLILYRGQGAVADLPSDINAYDKLIGKTFQDKGFTSTSVDNPFGGGIKLIIEAPKGTPAAYIKSISHHKGENEVLLAAGTKFQILEAAKVGNQINVRVRIVP